jgi:hypothetical protein
MQTHRNAALNQIQHIIKEEQFLFIKVQFTQTHQTVYLNIT